MTDGPGWLSPLLDHDPAEAGPFRLIGRLGSGGMGVVYAGLSAAGERVAVKVVHPELAHDQEFRTRFAREVTLLEKVRGACIVRMLDADANAPSPWLATEYVPGPTLEAHVRAHGPLAGDELYGVSDARLRKLGSRSAIFRHYRISCGPRFAFRPEIWWLPKTRLMMTVVALPDRYRQTADAIATSIEFS